MEGKSVNYDFSGAKVGVVPSPRRRKFTAYPCFATGKKSYFSTSFCWLPV
jgi:hypothetical protein